MPRHRVVAFALPVLARVAFATALVIGLGGVLAGCADRASAARSATMSECRLRNFAQAAQCTTVQVPENRTQPGGRQIGIFVALLPANTVSPRPDPLVILAGGPGQAASTLAPFASRLDAVRRTRDLVLVDQRGTGRSAALACKAFSPDDRAEFELDPLPKARDCLAELTAQGVDPAQYTTEAFVEDLEAVRTALGYPRLNLWGGSYGTRVALEYLRRHPDHVRSMVLDGVVPPSMKVMLDVWQSRNAALDAIIAACRDSASCRAAHPDPAATLDAIARDLAGGRLVTIDDPRTGVPHTVTLTFDHVVGALQPLTYLPELASMIPELLARARAGDYGPLVAASRSLTTTLDEQMNAALHFSVTCSEDAPRVTAQEVTEALSHTRVADLARRTLSVCDAWPRGHVPADFATPVTSDVPALLLSGGLDPVTPPKDAAEVARTLGHSRQVVAAGFGHIVSPHACAPQLVAAFVDRAGFDTLPAECITFLEQTKRPPFFVDRLVAKP